LQYSDPEHEPQLLTYRDAPQLSTPLPSLQSWLMRAQKAGSLSGTQGPLTQEEFAQTLLPVH
jgi:hypothetical protein